MATATVKRGAVATYYASTATLEAERTAPLLARVEGVVRSIAHEEGDSVPKGRVLLRLDNDEYALRAEQLAAQTARLEDQKARLEKMVKERLVGREELDGVVHDLRAAKAEEGLARLQVTRTAVRSPFNGRVVRRVVDVGQTVNVGDTLFELADMDPLIARVFVPSKEFKRLAPQQPVALTLDSSGVRLEGRIQRVAPVVDPSSGTIKVTVEIPKYPADTRPGDFAQVRIVTERHEDALVVPKIAVVEERSERVVFVPKGDKVVRTVVELGFEEGELVEVLKGLSETDSVVVKGQHSLKDGSSVEILES